VSSSDTAAPMIDLIVACTQASGSVSMATITEMIG
jgi:hypothetical protein